MNDDFKEELKDCYDTITRLRNELHIAQEWSARVIAGHEEDIREITRLTARVAELKGALRTIADGPRDADKTYAELMAEVCCEARAALSESQKAPAP